MEDLSARYSSVRNHQHSLRDNQLRMLQDGPKVLQNVTFRVKSGERVGIGAYIQFVGTFDC